MVTQLKSLVLTLGLMDLHLTVEQAVLLSRLEEEYQVRRSWSPTVVEAPGGPPGALGPPVCSRRLSLDTQTGTLGHRGCFESMSDVVAQNEQGLAALPLAFF